MRTIKEKTCYVSPNPGKEDKEGLGKTEEFRLPDGKAIRVGSARTLSVGGWADEGVRAISSGGSGTTHQKSCLIRHGLEARIQACIR